MSDLVSPGKHVGLALQNDENLWRGLLTRTAFRNEGPGWGVGAEKARRLSLGSTESGPHHSVNKARAPMEGPALLLAFKMYQGFRF